MTQRKDDTIHRVVVALKDKQQHIPRNKAGDPAFQVLRNRLVADDYERQGADVDSLLAVFTPQEIVAMVNRHLYQAEYQQRSHLKYQQAIRDREKPVKEAFRRLYPGVAYINATPQQIDAAIREAARQKAEEKK